MEFKYLRVSSGLSPGLRACFCFSIFYFFSPMSYLMRINRNLMLSVSTGFGGHVSGLGLLQNFVISVLVWNFKVIVIVCLLFNKPLIDVNSFCYCIDYKNVHSVSVVSSDCVFQIVKLFERTQTKYQIVWQVPVTYLQFSRFVKVN